MFPQSPTPAVYFYLFFSHSCFCRCRKHTDTHTHKATAPSCLMAWWFGSQLMETGGRRRGSWKLMDRENEKCHLDFSVNEQRNGQSVDLQWFIRLDPSAAVSSAWTVSYSSGTLVCNLVDLLLMNLSISLCLGCCSAGVCQVAAAPCLVQSQSERLLSRNFSNSFLIDLRRWRFYCGRAF